MNIKKYVSKHLFFAIFIDLAFILFYGIITADLHGGKEAKIFTGVYFLFVITINIIVYRMYKKNNN